MDTHRDQDRPVAPDGRCSQADLQREIDGVNCLPSLLGQIDKTRRPVDSGGEQRHGPGATDRLQIVEGEGHSKGENGGGGVPQPVREAHLAQISEAGSQQSRPSAQSGARRPDQGHPEGGIPLKDDRPGQHRRQQQMDTRLRP